MVATHGIAHCRGDRLRALELDLPIAGEYNGFLVLSISENFSIDTKANFEK